MKLSWSSAKSTSLELGTKYKIDSDSSVSVSHTKIIVWNWPIRFQRKTFWTLFFTLIIMYILWDVKEKMNVMLWSFKIPLYKYLISWPRRLDVFWLTLNSVYTLHFPLKLNFNIYFEYYYLHIAFTLIFITGQGWQQQQSRFRIHNKT